MRKLAIIGIGIIVGFFSIQSMMGQVVESRPTVSRTVVYKTNVKRGYAWIGGHWKWNPRKRGYVWVSGTYVKARPGRVWMDGYWRKVRGGWVWKSGYWKNR